MGSSVLESRLETALGVLRDSGLNIPRSGRHMRALHLLARLNSGDLTLDTSDDELLARVRAAHRTAWETFLITYAAWTKRKKHPNPFRPDRVQLILGGSELGDGRSSIARDTQFELFLLAMFVLAGADAKLGEPDVLFKYGYEWVGIAAKRVRSASESRLRRHIKKAMSQIDKSGHRGWVAINLDARFVGIDPDQCNPGLLARFDEVFDALDSLLGRMAGNRNVLGVILYGYLSEWIAAQEKDGVPQLVTRVPMRWFGWADDPGEEVLFNDFTEGFSKRIDKRLAELAGTGPLY